MTTDKNETINISIDLRGEILAKFNDVFETSGLTSRTEFLRMLIAKEYRDQNRPPAQTRQDVIAKGKV